MTNRELAYLNIGQSLDNLMNTDPRGYGVCNLLYPAARQFTKMPLSISAALWADRLPRGRNIFIITGFVLPGFEKAETDGIIGALLLARGLIRASDLRPVIICPEDNLPAVKPLAEAAGIGFSKIPQSGCVCVRAFTKNNSEALPMAERLAEEFDPCAVLSTEHPGPNGLGIYHNSLGKDVTALESRADVLFGLLRGRGIPNLAIGDLGNELGMGSILSHLKEKIPFCGEGECVCGCGGGIASVTEADNILTATISDWGAYAMLAALAFVREDMDILHSPETEEACVRAAAEAGMIDMYGKAEPAIDGIPVEMHVHMVRLMGDVVFHALRLKEKTGAWFDAVIKKVYPNE